jgi:GDP-L-fucose synthase
MKLYIAGIGGMLGSALAARAKCQGFEVVGKSSSELNLLNRDAVFREICETRPDALVIAAAKVGGIKANVEFPVQFLGENLQIQGNLLDAAFKAEVDRVIFIGSSCIYPRDCKQPISEDSLMTGPLESTNTAYAIAKIAGIQLVESYRIQFGVDWRSVLPCNLYGPGDNFDLATGHVLSSLLRKFAKSLDENSPAVEIWGDGTPIREFLYVEDAADGILHVLAQDSTPSILNLGSGHGITIRELAELISHVVDYQGNLQFNPKMPNGTPKKVLDVSRITQTGWSAKVDILDGIRKTYKWYRLQEGSFRGG